MYISNINGIRAIAVVLVILSHLIKSPGISRFLYDIISFTDLGTIGVRMFFLLSGFLITFLLIIENNKNGFINIKDFFVRRILRIFPCFYFYLLVVLLLKILNIIQIEIDTILLAGLYLQNLNVFQLEPLFSSSWLVIHTWSLSVEEQFYLIYPFVGIRVVSNFKNWLLPILILCIGAFFRTLNYSYPNISRMVGGSFLMHLDYLLIGCYVAYLYNNKNRILQKLQNLKFIGIYILLAFIVMIFAAKFEFQSGKYMIFCGTLILFSNAFILSSVILSKSVFMNVILENKYLVFIGKLSYSLYVWQQLFLGSSGYWLKYQIVTHYPFNILAIIFCALISYFVVEMPFLKLKSKFSNSGYSNHKK